MSKEKKEAEELTQQVSESVEFTQNIVLSEEIKKEISKKAEELKTQNKLRKIFVVIVEGDEGDEKPLYIAYMRRPGLIHFSQYMNFVQKDLVQANKMLASNVFISGDRELIDDDDLFLYGTMPQLAQLIESRNAELVKK